jgi:hypothetical protein
MGWGTGSLLPDLAKKFLHSCAFAPDLYYCADRQSERDKLPRQPCCVELPALSFLPLEEPSCSRRSPSSCGGIIGLCGERAAVGPCPDIPYRPTAPALDFAGTLGSQATSLPGESSIPYE